MSWLITVDLVVFLFFCHTSYIILTSTIQLFQHPANVKTAQTVNTLTLTLR